MSTTGCVTVHLAFRGASCRHSLSIFSLPERNSSAAVREFNDRADRSFLSASWLLFGLLHRPGSFFGGRFVPENRFPTVRILLGRSHSNNTHRLPPIATYCNLMLFCR